MTKQLPFDPNPGYGGITFSDGLRALVGFLFILGQSLLFLLCRSLRKGETLSRLDFQIFVTRKSLACLPLSVLRRPASTAHIASSRRYRQRLRGLPELVNRREFSGYWITKHGFDSTSHPRHADIILIFAHGGGYVMSQPAQYAAMLLCVAERVEAEGLKMAIFALDYSLAPEYRFPRQLEQMVACWQYLVDELPVPAAAIALAGDSAGGSLCLSFLAHLKSPAPGVAEVASIDRPGRGLFLLSPWVSLSDETGYAEKADKDLIDRKALRSWAQAVTLGVDHDTVRKYFEFAQDRADLGSILPKRLWVSAGEQELFNCNISRFVDNAKKAGVEVAYDVRIGGVHDWQFMEAVSQENQFLDQEFGIFSEGLMSGATALAVNMLSGSKKSL